MDRVYKEIANALNDVLEPFDAPFVVHKVCDDLSFDLFGWAVGDRIIVRRACIKMNGNDITDVINFSHVKLPRLRWLHPSVVYRPDYTAVSHQAWSQGGVRGMHKKYLDSEYQTKNIKNGKVQF